MRVANPTQYSLLLLLHCWMLIGCVVLGCVEFRALKREVVLCATGFLHPSIKKRNSLTIVQNGQPFLGVNVPHLDVTFGGCRGCRLSMSGRFKIRMDLVVERNWMSRDCASLRTLLGLAQLGFLISLSSYQYLYQYLVPPILIE